MRPTRHIDEVPKCLACALGPEPTLVDQVRQVAGRGGLGGAGEVDVLLCVQTADEPVVARVEKALQDLELPLIED